MNSNVNKMTVIININTMRNMIGLPASDVNFLLKKTYDELHEEQNSLIKHYNEAVRNKANSNS